MNVKNKTLIDWAGTACLVFFASCLIAILVVPDEYIKSASIMAMISIAFALLAAKLHDDNVIES